MTEAVAARAADYARSGIGVLDALHLAAAVESRADYFVTTDDRLLKKGRTVDTAHTAVVTPLELAARLEPP